MTPTTDTNTHGRCADLGPESAPCQAKDGAGHLGPACKQGITQPVVDPLPSHIGTERPRGAPWKILVSGCRQVPHRLVLVGIQWCSADHPDPPAGEGPDVTWVGVSGSWRYAPPGLPDAVHREVAAALGAGKNIVTGGALGVDYWATETALGIGPARLKVILPTSLATYAAHYRRRAAEGSHLRAASRRPGQAAGGRGASRRPGRASRTPASGGCHHVLPAESGRGGCGR